MAKHVIVALTNPIEGREADYNLWFEERHIPELLAVPQILSAQRFEIASDQLLPVAPPYRYITTYEIEADNLAEALSQFGQAAQAGTKTDASDISRRDVWVYTPKGAKRTTS